MTCRSCENGVVLCKSGLFAYTSHSKPSSRLSASSKLDGGDVVGVLPPFDVAIESRVKRSVSGVTGSIMWMSSETFPTDRERSGIASEFWSRWSGDRRSLLCSGFLSDNEVSSVGRNSVMSSVSMVRAVPILVRLSELPPVLLMVSLVIFICSSVQVDTIELLELLSAS